MILPAKIPAHVVVALIKAVLITFLAAMAIWGTTKPFGRAFLLIVAGSFVLVEFVLPWFAFRREGGGYLERLRAAHEDDAQRRNSAFHALVDRLGIGRYLIMVLTILTLGGAYALGEHKAKSARSFLVAGDYIVLRHQGESLLCARFFGDALTGDFEFRPEAGQTLTLKPVGPIAAYSSNVTADSEK
jgi:hypothetical protein